MGKIVRSTNSGKGIEMLSFLIFNVVVLFTQAHDVSTKSETVLTNLDQARAVGGVILSQDVVTNLAVAYLTQLQLNQLSILNHSQGKCAGFERLTATEANQPGVILSNLATADLKIKTLSLAKKTILTWNEDFQKMADLANPNQLQETVAWISSYPSRYNKAPNPNQHVDDLKNRLQQWLQGAKWNFQIETIDHHSTKQKTLRVTIPGKSRPQEVIVMGGHFDSINQGYFSGDLSPGADDNASGSANLIEALKILKNSEQPERTWEFYWYAGEESGLLGSAEISKLAKEQSKNVIAVLQLDMTLFPGSGEHVVGLITDYTSPWLRDILTSINSTYVKARLVDDKCGYGCSDHASWHRQGYHAVTPFEATTSTMNHYIHTEKDVIDTRLSFLHSNSFTKYTVLFALVLGNSDMQPPVF